MNVWFAEACNVYLCCSLGDYNNLKGGSHQNQFGLVLSESMYSVMICRPLWFMLNFFQSKSTTSGVSECFWYYGVRRHETHLEYIVVRYQVWLQFGENIIIYGILQEKSFSGKFHSRNQTPSSVVFEQPQLEHLPNAIKYVLSQLLSM